MDGGEVGAFGGCEVQAANMSSNPNARGSPSGSGGRGYIGWTHDAGHNAGFRRRLPRGQRMWVIYLNIAIAVIIAAFFIVWTIRSRK
jgi:hypothetical protein